MKVLKTYEAYIRDAQTEDGEYIPGVYIDHNTEFPKNVGQFPYNNMIDYTELDPNADEKQLEEICNKAKIFNVATICVAPQSNERKVELINFAKDCLEGSNVGITTVISFPEGTNSLEEKISETKSIVSLVTDVDMVLNYQMLKENWNEDEEDLPLEIYDFLVEEVSALTEIAHNNGAILKVIVESGLLTEEQTKVATDICLEAGADFIKTSTGKVDVGAEPDKVKVMTDTISDDGSDMEIKASGGVRTLDDIKTYEGLGVTRFGMGYGSVDKLNNLDGGDSNY